MSGKAKPGRGELLLLAASVVITLAIALGLLRWLAPGLLGVPPDLQVVRTSAAVPPFYENVFRVSDFRTRRPIIPGPFVGRAKPLGRDIEKYGPNDLLGFRNRSIPTAAPIIAIGDSQTYGTNVTLERNWPSTLARELGLPYNAVYAMATGGWSAIEYAYIADKAHLFQPKAILVAFYAGNDPLEAFLRAYGNPNWSEYRPNPRLTADDAPDVTFPPKRADIWSARFPDGTQMDFTPKLRLPNVQRAPATDAGWEIMIAAAEQISNMCARSGVELVLTLIPTKETALRKRIEMLGVATPPTYRKLVDNEKARSAAFAERLRLLSHGRYVDVIRPLQAAAARDPSIYPRDRDGHPYAPGYRIVAQQFAAALNAKTLLPRAGAYAVGLSDKRVFGFRLLTRNGWWVFKNTAALTANGWQLAMSADPAGLPNALILSDGTEFANLPFLGVISESDPDRFTPSALSGYEFDQARPQ